MVSFPLGKWIRVELLCHSLSVCLMLAKTTKLFSNIIVAVSIPTTCSGELQCCTALLPLGMVFLHTAMLESVQNYLIVALIYISRMTNNIGHVLKHLLAICTFSLGQFSIQIFCSFSELSCLIFIELQHIIIWSGYRAFIKYVLC